MFCLSLPSSVRHRSAKERKTHSTDDYDAIDDHGGQTNAGLNKKTTPSIRPTRPKPQLLICFRKVSTSGSTAAAAAGAGITFAFLAASVWYLPRYLRPYRSSKDSCPSARTDHRTGFVACGLKFFCCASDSALKYLERCQPVNFEQDEVRRLNEHEEHVITGEWTLYEIARRIELRECQVFRWWKCQCWFTVSLMNSL